MRIVGYGSAVASGEEGGGVSRESRWRVLLRWFWEKSVFCSLLETWGKFLQSSGIIWLRGIELSVGLFFGGQVVDYHLANERKENEEPDTDPEEIDTVALQRVKLGRTSGLNTNDRHDEGINRG